MLSSLKFTCILFYLIGHLVSHHNKHIKGLKTYTCHFCKYQCADRYRLIEHELTHTSKSPNYTYKHNLWSLFCFITIVQKVNTLSFSNKFIVI